MTRARPRSSWLAATLALLTGVALSSGAADPSQSRWAHPGPDGKLVYATTPAGDRIMDFSHTGYMGGGVALPDVPVKRTVTPSGAADETAAIQTALDVVAALPLENGFRGAVRLGPGTFPCAGTLNVTASGVVLRGSGTGAGTGTTLQLTGRPHNAIAVRSPGGRTRSGEEAEGARTTISDTYVPSGATSFTVASAAGFAPGDRVLVRRPVTAAWVKAMQMDDLVRDGKPQTWIAVGKTTDTERRIAAVAGNRITLDVPLSDSFDARLLSPPGTAVVKIRPPSRVSQCGIESLRIVSPPQAISHTQPHFTALRITGEDCWARDLAIEETMNSVAVGGRRITLQRVSVTRKALHQGASKPAEFAPNGTQVLCDRCTVSGDNIWYVATGAGIAGPIVMLNCAFQGNGHAESHQRWSTGMLYDGCRAPGGGLDFRNRGSMGSGHGWSMGWGVMWNCEAKTFLVQNPPGAVNWLIGCRGERQRAPRPFAAAPDLPEGTGDSPDAPVAPASLYLAQLAGRLGPGALRAIGYGGRE